MSELFAKGSLQRLDVGGHGRSFIFRHICRINNGAAYNDTIGDLADFGGLFRGANAKTDCQWHRGFGPHPIHKLIQVCLQILSYPCHSR